MAGAKRTRPKPPCKDCPDRAAGCHPKCARWAAYKQADAQWKAEHQPPSQDVADYFVKRDEAIHKLYSHRDGKKI